MRSQWKGHSSESSERQLTLISACLKISRHIWINQHSWITAVGCHYICLQGGQWTSYLRNPLAEYMLPWGSGCSLNTSDCIGARPVLVKRPPKQLVYRNLSGSHQHWKIQTLFWSPQPLSTEKGQKKKVNCQICSIILLAILELSHCCTGVLNHSFSFLSP